MDKAERKILTALYERGFKTATMAGIELAKEAAKVLGKPANFPAERRFKLKNFVGFEAYLNLDSDKLQHWLECEKLLQGSVWHKADISKHSFLRRVPQLIVTFPLDCSEVRKRVFLQRATKFFKEKLTKLDVKVLSKDGKEYSYGDARKTIRTDEVKEIKANESSYRPPKGKRDGSYYSKKQKRNLEIIGQVEERHTTGRKLSHVFKTVAGRHKDPKISPRTVQNIYYAGRREMPKK